ncbi:MAG: stage III sporulation protein AE [Lachnospiraceae bacterium]|nr:stage III sporulation protein AE [Lachnospiraceae bacterium]
MENWDGLWQEYGLEKLKEGLRTLFPDTGISAEDMLEKLMSGDVAGALGYFFQGTISGMADSFQGMKNILVWLVVLGVVSALVTHFVEIFDRHQVAELGFYFMYLLQAAILLKCFSQVMQTAVGSMEEIVLFVKLLVPTYLVAVGVASGSATVSANYQLVLILIYIVESILTGFLLPMIYTYMMLAILNGIFSEEKLTLLMEFLEKGIGWILKAALGAVTGISLFQAVITPAIDSVKSTALQKAVSAIPGVGNAAEGIFELAVGSAVIIKNSIGVFLLILLLGLCMAPLLKILLMGILLKGAAALMGIVSDKRITACADHAGDAVMMLFRTVGTAMLLFLICLSLVAAATNRGI